MVGRLKINLAQLTIIVWSLGDEEVEETQRRDGTEENSLESDEEKRVEVSGGFNSYAT